MIFNEELFADAGLLLLGISALGYVLQVLIPKNWLRNLSSGLLALATGSLITSLVFRSMDAEFFALSNMYEALLVLTIAFGIAYLIIERWFKVYNMGWAVCLLALVIMFYAGSLPTEINPLQAALRSYWRSIHVPPLLLSYGFFTLAFLSAIAFLFTSRNKGNFGGGGHKEALATRDGGGVLAFSTTNMADLYDEVTYRCIAAGFPLLMIGVILGAIWANEAWGNYWSWDPKESMSLVTLLGYGAYLHMRINGEHSKKTLALVSIAGFVLMLMTFVGVNVWGFGSLHSYGSVG
jgi:cytochrome c-type biogenesis protein CcsB